MVILHIHSPLQAIIPFVTVQQCELIAFAGSSIIKACLFHLTCAHIHINNVRDIRKIGRSAESESGNFLHTAVTHINKGRTGSGIRQPVTIAVMIDGRQLSATFMVELCQSKLIDLCAVLILCKAKFERTRVKILIDTSTVEPVLADASVQVEIKLLFAKVIGIIIQHAIEILSLVQSQFGKRVHSITDVSGSNGSFGYFKQSGMSQATVSTPVRVYIMGI